MKLAYYVPASLLRHEGIRRRSEATAAVWRRLGHDVHELRADGPPRSASPAPLLRWHREQDRGAARRVAEQCRSGEVDHVHVRLFVPTRPWLSVPCDVSLEVHSLLRRPESLRDAARVALAGPTAAALVGRAAAGAFVTEEMAAHRDYRRLRVRLALGNGVPRQDAAPPPDNDRPVVGMAVGTVGRWHGLDRLARLAADLDGIRTVVIAPADIAPAVAGVVRGGPVEVWPTRDRNEYEVALGRLDAAVGTLAFDRIGLTEAAPLKVRDYVMRGIPTLLTYEDTNLGACADPALMRTTGRLDGDTARRLRDWLGTVRGRRLADTTRDLVDLEHVERRRLSVITGAG
jgi:hypothetical protein